MASNAPFASGKFRNMGKLISRQISVTSVLLLFASFSSCLQAQTPSFKNKEIALFKHDNEEIISVAFNSLGRRIAAGDIKNKLTVWECKTGRELWSIKNTSGLVTENFFCNDDKFLIANEFFFSLDFDNALVRPPANDVDARDRISPPTGGALRVRDSETGRVLRTLHSGGSNLALMGVDNKSLVYALGLTPSLKIQVWDPDTGRSLREVGEPAAIRDGPLPVESDNTVLKLNRFAFSTAAGRLAFTKRAEQRGRLFRPRGGGSSRPLECFLNVWDLNNNYIQAFKCNSDNSISAIAITRDGDKIATEATDRTINLWDANTGQVLRTFKTPLEGRTFIGRKPNVLTFDVSGTRLFSSTSSGSIQEWDCASGRLLRQIIGTKGRVRTIAFLNDRLRVVTGGEVSDFDPASHSVKLEPFRLLEADLFPNP